MCGKSEPADGFTSDSNEQYENIGETPDIPLPELEAGAGYLVSFFNSAGMAMTGGYGLSPLSWQELKAWVECTNMDISMWELEMVRKMSEAYVSEAGRATNKSRKAPYSLSKEDTRNIVDRKARSIFSGLKKKSSE